MAPVPGQLAPARRSRAAARRRRRALGRGGRRRLLCRLAGRFGGVSAVLDGTTAGASVSSSAWPASSRCTRSGTRSPSTSTAPCWTATRRRPGSRAQLNSVPTTSTVARPQAMRQRRGPPGRTTNAALPLDSVATKLVPEDSSGCSRAPAARVMRDPSESDTTAPVAGASIGASAPPSASRSGPASPGPCSQNPASAPSAATVDSAIKAGARRRRRPGPRASIPLQIRASVRIVRRIAQLVPQRETGKAHDTTSSGLSGIATCSPNHRFGLGDAPLGRRQRAAAHRGDLGQLQPFDPAEHPGDARLGARRPPQHPIERAPGRRAGRGAGRAPPGRPAWRRRPRGRGR